MAMSMGQEKGYGHSHGPMGHGGHHSGGAMAVAYKGPGNVTSHLTHPAAKGSHTSSSSSVGDGEMTHMPGNGGMIQGC